MSEGNFECKVSGKRESANGIFLTLQIQPDDYTSELATLRVGAALVLGWAEVIDATVHKLVPYRPEPPTVTLTVETANVPKDRRPFASLPLSQQAAIRCQDRTFVEFLDKLGLASDPPEDWDPAEVVRIYCRISSRAELDKPTPNSAKDHWHRLNGQYEAWLTDRKYAGARR